MRYAFAVVLAIALLSPFAAFAQDDNRDHFEVGVFADYVRLSNARGAPFWGAGGRVGFGAAPHLNIEADMAYDFERTVTNTFTGTNISGVTITASRSSDLRLLHGTFGPMLWVGSKRARLFVQAKGGFLNFSGPQAPSGFTGAVSTFGGDTNGVFYPGGGAEFSVGPIGLRLDVGDLMYFDNGANHNLSIKIGPTIHF